MYKSILILFVLLFSLTSCTSSEAVPQPQSKEKVQTKIEETDNTPSPNHNVTNIPQFKFVHLKSEYVQFYDKASNLDMKGYEYTVVLQSQKRFSAQALQDVQLYLYPPKSLALYLAQPTKIDVTLTSAEVGNFVYHARFASRYQASYSQESIEAMKENIHKSRIYLYHKNQRKYKVYGP